MSTPHPAPDTLEPAVSPAPTRGEFRLAILDRLPIKEDGAKESANAFAKNSGSVRLTTPRGMFAHFRHFGASKRPEEISHFLKGENFSSFLSRG